MSKFNTKSALDAFSREWGGLSVKEITTFELVSIAVAKGHNAEFEQQFRAVLNTSLPMPNQVLPAEGGSVMWTGQDQYMVMLGHDNVHADTALGNKLGTSAYCSLQSDAWAVLRVEGKRMMDVFERVIPLDLSNAPANFAARTSAHHIAIIIVKLLDGSVLFLTPRSSARSFLSTLIHTVDNVIV